MLQGEGYGRGCSGRGDRAGVATSGKAAKRTASDLAKEFESPAQAGRLTRSGWPTLDYRPPAAPGLTETFT
jgi:hypothetical protein